MYRVIDADGHIFEWQDTFADRYLDEEYHHRRPGIVEGPQQLHWLVDNVVYPGLYGKGGAFQVEGARKRRRNAQPEGLTIPFGERPERSLAAELGDNSLGVRPGGRV